MKSILVIITAVAAMLLTACTYTRNFDAGKVTFREEPDGTKTMEIEDYSEEETLKFDITGMSKREIRNRIPFPLMEEAGADAEAANPVGIEYRYEYRFDVYDINGNFADTITVETYNDFVAMLPVACSLAGFPVPPQADLDALAADMLPHWVDPETDWHIFN